MKQRTVISLMVHRLIWAALALTFLFVTAPTIFRGVTANSLEPAQSFHSTDDYLKRLTDVSHASRRILGSLIALPSQKPILILMREGDGRSGFLAMTMAYLAWPREVQISSVSGKTADAQLARIDPASLGAVIFCRVDPPAWVPAGTWIGDTLKIVPLGPHEIANK
jgi:hypothetical protein